MWSIASEVSRGEVVAESHLAPTEVAVTSAAAVLQVSDVRASDLVGGLWAADLLPGAMLSPGLIVERLEVASGETLIGLALPPGGWPSPALRAGDTVMVVGTGDASPILVDRATVDSVTLLGDAVAGTRLVTVAVPEGAAAEVATAAAAGEVALVVAP